MLWGIYLSNLVFHVIMKILIYTFRTFPYLPELNDVFPYVFIMGSLKEDLSSFYSLIMQEKPDFILGVAASTDGKSYFESRTVNRFNKMGRVIAGGKEELILFVPNDGLIPVSTRVSTGFCNYTMYSIASYIEHKKMSTRFAFCHVAVKDIKLLPSIINVISL